MLKSYLESLKVIVLEKLHERFGEDLDIIVVEITFEHFRFKFDA